MIAQQKSLNARKCNQLVRERVWVEHLKIGMYVAELDRPWLGTPFLLQGFLLTDASDIALVREHCQYVAIDIAKTKLSQREVMQAINKPRDRKTTANTVNYSISVEREIKNAHLNFVKAKHTLDKAFKAFRCSEEVNLPEIKTTIKSCIKSIRNNPNAMIWLSQIKNCDDYTAEHSLRVAMLAISLGAALGLNNNALEELGVGAMLHDVGKMEIPEEVLNKEGALSKDEYETMKKHADIGRDLLLSQSGLPMSAAEIAHSHHEHVAGGGYPRGLMHNEIHPYAKIVSVVDAFDAITSKRVYSDARSALDALKILYECRDRQFDKDIVQTFIRMIGVYPPGNIVELSDGSIAIVLSSSPDSKLKPKVMLVRNRKKQLCQNYIVDLSCQEGNDALSIDQVLSDGSYGVNLKSYLDMLNTNEQELLSA